MPWLRLTPRVARSEKAVGVAIKSKVRGARISFLAVALFLPVNASSRKLAKIAVSVPIPIWKKAITVPALIANPRNTAQTTLRKSPIVVTLLIR